jgi:hypothetical protein
MRHWNVTCIVAGLLALGSTASASTFVFNTDPFAGTPVLTTPGRQIVGGEEFINFNIATDVFALDSSVFGVGDTVRFANGPVSALPANPNVVVLESFDDDNNPLTPFGAGQAANLIASKVTNTGPGFFIYFNQSLNLARLVYSTDLSSTDSDLKILARMLNLFGDEGKNELPNFTASNFEFTSSAATAPEPSGLVMIAGGLLFVACSCFLRRRSACS